jgi:hypothetical protein
VSVKVQERAMWPGIARIDVDYEIQRIDVTAFGDPAPRYVSAGPPVCHVRIDCDPQSLERLLAVIELQPPDRDGDPRPEVALAVRPVRYMTLSDD